MYRLLLIFAVIYFVKVDGSRRRCINSGILFSSKILGSPIVIYGETISKQVYRDTNAELLSNVTFRVDCVLKGQNVEHEIDITEVGIKSGHMACQWLDPGFVYVVFLETWGNEKNTYRPVDFQELVVDDNTKELLAKTCRLTRRQALNSLHDNCPNVSASGYCPYDNIDTNIAPRERPSSYQNPFVKSSYFDQEDQFYLQSNVTMLKTDRSLDTSIHPRSTNNAFSVKFSWFLLLSHLLLKVI